jgi:hypothetical protein
LRFLGKRRMALSQVVLIPSPSRPLLLHPPLLPPSLPPPHPCSSLSLSLSPPSFRISAIPKEFGAVTGRPL